MSSANGTTKDDFLSRIWTICTTLTEEAMAVASAKGKELGFDPNRGLVPLPESFINLSSARSIIEDAIEKQKLVQLPISVQKELLGNLETISKSLQGLTSGVDEVVNLTTAIEALNTAIWKYGLHNLSDQVLGYQKKLNQLKNQELQISKVMTQLEGAAGAIERVNTAASETEQQKNNALALVEGAKQSATSSASLLEQVKEASTKVGALFATIQQNEKQSGEFTASIKTANNELVALDASIRKFYGEVDEYRRKITQTGEDASKLITSSEAAVRKLIEETSAKTEETIAMVRTDSKMAIDDLKAKVDEAVKASDASTQAAAESLSTKIAGKMEKDEESFLNLTSTTTANITTFQTAAEGELAQALKALGTSSSNLIGQSQEKLTDLEQKVVTRSEETIEVNHKKTAELIAELARLKDQIREQIQQATGFQLFGAFQARQNEIAKSKDIWVYAIAALVVISAGVTIWIAHEAQFYSVNTLAFWVKLSLTVPLGFAITFCTVQYGRERRLEEEYAFKSSISVSLNPYRDLVHTILEKDGQVDQSKYTDFVISSVTNVFTPPTDKVFDADKKSGFTQKTFKQTAEIIGTAVKAAK